MAKIYELTTNGEDGYRKYYVVGINSDEEARKLSKKVLGKYAWLTGGGITHYSSTEYEKEMGRTSKYWMTKSEFMKLKRRYNP